MTIHSHCLNIPSLLRGPPPSISRSRQSTVPHEKMAYVMASLRLVFQAVILASLASHSLPALAAPPSNSDADAQAGALLFRDKGCAYCHGVGGVGSPKAPSLVDIRNDKAWTPEKMNDQILNGGQKMPPFRESLNDEEIAQLVTYLRAKVRPIPPPLPDGSPTPAVPVPKQ
jgi:nicotinate dehydrogenase subunit B